MILDQYLDISQKWCKMGTVMEWYSLWYGIFYDPHKVMFLVHVFVLNVCPDWIMAVVGDDRSARCKACDIVLPADHAVLTQHSQNSQHLQHLSSLSSPTKKTLDHSASTKLQVTILKVLPRLCAKCSYSLLHLLSVCSTVAKCSVNVTVCISTLWFTKTRPLLYFQKTSTNIGHYQQFLVGRIYRVQCSHM